MARAIGRRPLFFFLAAIVCAVLVPATPSDLRWVNWVTAGLGGFWGVLLALEELLGPGRQEGPRRRPPESGTPFAPPPPPGGGGRPDR
jgi:hypothetical protein